MSWRRGPATAAKGTGLDPAPGDSASKAAPAAGAELAERECPSLNPGLPQTAPPAAPTNGD